MTSMAGKLTLVFAAAGGLSVAALSPVSVEAGVIGRPMLAAASGTSDIVRVVCDRRLSNLWSCNDDPVIRDRRDVRVQDRRVPSPNRYASQCERTLSNLWSCNDDPAIRDRRDERVQDRRVQSPNRYAAHPCDHSYETARDGSRCGNRAADRKPGGR
jgi:hypothetical protein